MKILIVRIGALGDAIHALPMVNEVKRLLPEAEIHWAAGPGVLRFLDGHPAVTRFIKVGRGIAGIMDAYHEVKGKYDCAIDCQGLMKSAYLARAAAPRVIGRARGAVREWPAAWLYTDKVLPAGIHVIEQNLDLLKPLVPDHSVFEIKYDLPYDEPPSWPLLAANPILFNIGGGWWTKLWPIENFTRLAAMIDEVLGAPVGVLWGPGEEEAARAVCAGSRAELAPPTLFRQLIPIFAKSRLLVSGETGPLHLAVASGCRTVALLGPTAGERNGPYGDSHVTIEPELPCRPCHARTCADYRCMPMITPERVFAEIAKMFS